MLKLAALALVAVSAAWSAMPWDGTRGPFSVLTYVSPGHMPGVPSGSGVTYTVIRVECSDPTISGVRLKFTYRDGDGERQVSMLSDIINGHAGFVTAVPVSEIRGFQLIELRESGSYLGN